MIEIDGAYGESGGQMIRTAISLSSVTQKPVKIFNIRAGRPNPGLQPQHLMACKAVRNICRGSISGAELNSTKIIFEPGPIIGGRYEFDIGTAGSATLVAQTIIPILLYASKESEVRIIGGTHVIKSPGYDYFDKVFLRALSGFGINIKGKMKRLGYYPRGGGVIDLSVIPSIINGCKDWSKDETVEAIIRLSGLPKGVGIREKKIFLQNEIEKVHVYEDEALSLGNTITAWKSFRGAYVLGEKGKRAEEVAQECIDALVNETKDVDLHLADQLLIYAALAEGQTIYSTSFVSEHLRTNAYVISQFLGKKISIGHDNTVSVG